jgi:hypothetical protein
MLRKVNFLLTKFVRVNILVAAESQCDGQGLKMKKQAQSKGFWSWLLGCGQSNAGSQG